MKKRRLFLFRYMIYSFVAFFATSCADNIIKEENIHQLVIAAEDFKYTESSRTSLEIATNGALFTWNETDTIGIFPNEGSQVSFPMANGAGTKLAAFNGGGWALKQASSYTAYYPYRYNNTDSKKIHVSFNNQIQTGNGSTKHLGNYDYMVANATTPENGNVIFNFKHLASLIEVTLTIPQKGDVTSIGLISFLDEIFTNSGFYDLTSESPQIQAYDKQRSTYLTLQDIQTSTENETIKAYFMIAPGDYSKESIFLSLINNGVEYKESINLGVLEPGKAYRYNFVSHSSVESAPIIHIKEPGTLPSIIGKENKFNYTELKLIGDINGTDIRFIREMCTSEYPYREGLRALDLHETRIVAGGDSYFDQEYHTTENDIIGKYMFAYLYTIERLILPKGITTISEMSFYGSSNLLDINIPDNVCFIEQNGFKGCYRLETVKLPSKLKYIGDMAFDGCPNIQAFYGPFTSDDNKCIIFDNKLIRYASGSKNTSYDIPNTVTHLGEHAFDHATLTSIKIPASVEIIDKYAFTNCENLSSIQLPNSIIKIEDSAFSGSGLISIHIPNSVTVLHHNAFQHCQKLETYTGNFTSADNKCLILNNELASYATGNKAKEYIVNLNVRSIGETAFSGSTYLETIKITSPTIKVIDSYAFMSSKIQHIELGDNIERIEPYAFAYCNDLQSINIPSGIQQIPLGMLFCCESLKTVTLPESIQEIDSDFVAQTGKINVLSSIYCYAKTPPTCYDDITNISDKSGEKIYCDIYVPAESVEKYKSTYPWSLYPIHSIEELKQ